jgi:hypothetical protein
MSHKMNPMSVGLPTASTSHTRASQSIFSLAPPSKVLASRNDGKNAKAFPTKGSGSMSAHSETRITSPKAMRPVEDRQERARVIASFAS